MDNFSIDETGFLVYRTTTEDIILTNEIFNNTFGESLFLNEKTVYNKKTSRKAGILGEVVFPVFINRFYKDKTCKKSVDASQHDFLVGKKRIDVKTKMRNVLPNMDFEASFFLYQMDFEDVDGYVFLSTIPDLSRVWFCGYMDKSGCKNNPHGRIWLAGQTDKTNGKVFHADTFSILYKYTNQFLTLVYDE